MTGIQVIDSEASEIWKDSRWRLDCICSRTRL